MRKPHSRSPQEPHGSYRRAVRLPRPSPRRKRQRPRRRDRRIDLAQRPRRRVTRVREHLRACLQLPLVERGKPRETCRLRRAPEQGGDVPAFQRVRDLRDGAHVRGHVFAFGAVTPRGGNNELTALVAERNRQAVDFVFGGKVQRCVGREFQEAPDARGKLLDVLVAEHVSQRQHANGGVRPWQTSRKVLPRLLRLGSPPL